MKPEVGVGLPIPLRPAFSDSSLPSLRDFPTHHPLHLPPPPPTHPGGRVLPWEKGPSPPPSLLPWPEGGQKMPQCD